MRKRLIIGFVAAAMTASACSGAAEEDVLQSTPEAAVVTWFDAVDAGDVAAASAAIHPETLALILAIENDVPMDQLARFLSEGVPDDLQTSYWNSFSIGFTDFAEKPLSTLTVGRAAVFVSNGEEFASVPISGGPGSDSVVIVRKRVDGTWEVDMVASLGDGFSKLLLDLYEELGSDEASARVRLAYSEVVAPSMWAALVDGSFGDNFAVVALTILDRIEKETA
ncbi:MAG: hypothetical protein O3B42_09835 [Actinomycetota bacterium]|nr:hypothetical protein [Actinomycetota bacterium]